MSEPEKGEEEERASGDGNFGEDALSGFGSSGGHFHACFKLFMEFFKLRCIHRSPTLGPWGKCLSFLQNFPMCFWWLLHPLWTSPQGDHQFPQRIQVGFHVQLEGLGGSLQAAWCTSSVFQLFFQLKKLLLKQLFLHFHPSTSFLCSSLFPTLLLWTYVFLSCPLPLFLLVLFILLVCLHFWMEKILRSAEGSSRI